MNSKVIIGDCAEVLKQFPDEEWRDIEGYEGLYQISNRGQIKSFKRITEGEKLKLVHYKNDYPNIVLHDLNKKGKKFKVHRLVAKTFLQNPNNYPEINHKNGIKSDNRVENLEWCTPSQNIRHSFRMLGHASIRGIDSPRTSLTEEDVRQIYSLAINEEFTLRKIGEMFGISIACVSDIKKGRSWKHITNQKYVKKLHTNSKLDEKQVKEIYIQAWDGVRFLKDIGKDYNISQANVSNIKNGRHFVNVTQNLQRGCAS